MSQSKKKVLFVCTQNSARSQMAEGLLKSLYGDRFQAFSGGTAPSGLHPCATKAMAEIGIDISGHRSKHIDEFGGGRFDLVVTVCDRAREACPLLAGTDDTLHWSFMDPAGVSGDEMQRLAAFRKVRDEIMAKIAERLAPGPVAP